MDGNPPLVPVIQFETLEPLEAAAEHLCGLGYRNRITRFEELPETERRDWMNPDTGGFLLHLEQGPNYEKAMTELGRFFGCTD